MLQGRVLDLCSRLASQAIIERLVPSSGFVYTFGHFTEFSGSSWIVSCCSLLQERDFRKSLIILMLLQSS